MKERDLRDVKRSHADLVEKNDSKKTKPRALSFTVILCQQPPSDSVNKMSKSEKQRIGPPADVTVVVWFGAD